MLNTYRRHDAVFVICQNNTDRLIEVAALNDQAQKVTGYTSQELVGKSLLEFVDNEISALLSERVGFAESQDDVADALMRVRSIQMKIKSGQMQEFRLRVVRSEVMDGHPTFHLVLEDERFVEEESTFKQVLKQNFRGHEVLEEQTGLPNRASIAKDLEMFQFFAKKRQITACLAVLQLDNAAQMAAMMGAQVPYQVLKHLGQLCTQRLRREDQVGILSGDALGLILMQITPESARVVLNRLRWSAASMPVILDTGKRADPEISIAFHMIGETDPEKMIKACEKDAKAGSGVEGGTLHEVML